MVDDIEMIEDSDDNLIALSGKDTEKLTFRLSVLRAIELARVEGSKEMIKGGEVTMLIKGQPMRINNKDQRKIFQGCIETLYDLLDYYIKEEDYEEFKEIEESIQEDYNTCFDNFILTEKEKQSKDLAEKIQQIPPGAPQSDYYLQTFQNMLVKRYREKFRLLIKIFKKNKDLKSISESKAY